MLLGKQQALQQEEVDGGKDEQQPRQLQGLAWLLTCSRMPRVKWGVVARLSLLLLFATVSVKTYSYFAYNLTRKLSPLERLQDGLDSGDADKTDFSDGDLSWFAHLTDLHMSKFYDPNRAPDLSALCRFFETRVRPFAVLVSGDLTDGKMKNNYGGEQQKEEWASYRSVVRHCKIPWLDVRGNHDTFNVAHDGSDFNYFHKFSAQGPTHPRSYTETLRGQGNRSFGFVGLDLTPVPGLRRPLNFFGIVDAKELQSVEHLLAKAANNSDHTVVFGHYPTSAVTGEGLRDSLAGNVYLCGHFHAVYGHDLQMYTRHPNGLLELELGDWKDYRRYRVMAFDQGLLAFSDATFHPNRPNVLTVVTNPPDPRFLRPNSEKPFSRVRNSKKVRVLVFSDIAVEGVKLMIPSSNEKRGLSVMMTNEKLPFTAAGESSPLYSAYWDSNDYREGLHKLQIQVLTKGETTYEFEHYFSLDGSQLEYDRMSRTILMMDWAHFSQVAFGFVSFMAILTLTLLRTFHYSHFEQGRVKVRLSSHRRVSNCVMRHLRKYFMLAAVDGLFWPLVMSVIAHCFLPWALGYILEDRLGIIFAWGVAFLDDIQFAPPDLTYLLGLMTMLIHFVPLIWLLARELEASFFERDSNTSEDPSPSTSGILYNLVALLYRHAGFCILFILLSHSAHVFRCMYGYVALFGPFGLGKLILLCHLYRNAMYFSEAEFIELQLVWSRK